MLTIKDIKGIVSHPWGDGLSPAKGYDDFTGTGGGLGHCSGFSTYSGFGQGRGTANGYYNVENNSSTGSGVGHE